MQNAGTVYTAQMWRQHLTASMGQGVIGDVDWKVSQHAAGANMQVDIDAGSGAVVGTEAAGQGVYLVTSDAVESVTLDSSPPSGQSRIDLVIARVRDSSVTGSDDDMIFDKVTGTPSSGTPVVPTPPASSMVLAQVTVAGLASSIVNANITDKRLVAPQGTQPLGVLPPMGTPGQIVGLTNGTSWIALSSGAWVPLSTTVSANSATPSNVNFGGGTWQSWFGGDVTISDPGYGIMLTGEAQFYVRGGTGAAVLQTRLGLSANNGTTWSYCPVQWVASAGTLDFKPVHLRWDVFPLSGAYKMRVEGNCGSAGGMSCDGAYFTLTTTAT